MADNSSKKIYLKALVDKRSNRVIFAEYDANFLDFLLSLLTIRMGTIIRYGRSHLLAVEIGSLKNLFLSAENLNAQSDVFSQ